MSPEEYIRSVKGWQREVVEMLRALVVAAAKTEEVIKWGHLVYFSGGPVLLIRAEEARVLFGFWRGQRLTKIEPALKPSGKYEMATLELREGSEVKAVGVRRLVRAAVALNEALGDPREAAVGLNRKKKSAT